MCDHEKLEEVIMPNEYIHYSKIICKKCKKFQCWGKSPDTTKLHEIRIKNIYCLLSKNLNKFEREFLTNICPQRTLSPKQQKVYDNIIKYYNKIL